MTTNTFRRGDNLKKRDIPEQKRFVAETTTEFHRTVKAFCVKRDIDLKEFCIEAIKEKYEREGGADDKD